MPVPKTPRVVYAHNPLVEVICQLRYPTILEIASVPPADFQSKVREQYPLYQRDDQLNAPPELREVLKQIPVQIQTQPVHRFAAEDESRTISLSTEFIAVSTSEYKRWEGFYTELKRAQTALEGVYHPPFYTRIGLRYRDLVDRAEIDLRGTSWNELLRGTFLGLLGADEVRSQVLQVNTHILLDIPEVPGGKAAIQHGIVKRGPDQDDAYLIDVDYFTEERSTGDGVEHILRTFNEVAGDLFRWAVTEQLSDALGKADDRIAAHRSGDVT